MLLCSVFDVRKESLFAYDTFTVIHSNHVLYKHHGCCCASVTFILKELPGDTSLCKSWHEQQISLCPDIRKTKKSCRVMIRFSEDDVINPEYDSLVSRELITKYSEFFRATFEHTCFIEAQQGVVVLPKIELVKFQGFVDWLYEGAGFRNVAEPEAAHFEDLRPYIKGPKSTSLARKARLRSALRMYSRHVRAWIWADMRQMPEYQNWLMGQLIDGVEVGAHVRFLDAPTVEFVYSNTIRGSKIRKLQVDSFTSFFLHPTFKTRILEAHTDYQEYEPAFLEEALLESLRGVDRAVWPTKVYNRALYMVPTERRDRSLLAASK